MIRSPFIRQGNKALQYLPHLGEANTPRLVDVERKPFIYDCFMTRVYLADALHNERNALRLLLLDLNMQVVGEAADWPTVFAQVPKTMLDMLLIDWDLLPNGSVAALAELRMICPGAIVIVLISHLDARQQAALSAGADAFISKGETPDRVAARLLAAAEFVRL